MVVYTRKSALRKQTARRRSGRNWGLGQGSSPSGRLVPGTSFVLSFGYTGGWTGGPLQGDIRSVLAKWAPFSTGKLILLDVLSGNNSIILTIQAQIGSDVFAIGGLGSAIADMLNSALPGWNIVPTGLNAIGSTAIPGTGTTSFTQQFQEAGGITLSPFASVTQESGPSAIPVALLGAGALILYLVLR